MIIIIAFRSLHFSYDRSTCTKIFALFHIPSKFPSDNGLESMDIFKYFLVNCGTIFFGKLWDIFKYFLVNCGAIFFGKLWDIFKYFLVNCGALFFSKLYFLGYIFR